jgi:hypothetical protein
MGYVIAAILVVLVVGGFVLFLVTNATSKSNVSDAGDAGADGTPAGDTPEHSDSDEGTAVPDGATGDRPDVARPVVGGEAEGERSSH